jgi:tripartite-type tricarboxylate transporter receptor subunit TctC
MPAVKLRRREFLQLAAGAGGLCAFARPAAALDYPTRPVRFLVGFGPGGAPDILARLMGQWLSERLQQSFVVENRPGASSSIATETVITAPADGYTLLLASLANVVNATLYEKLNYNFIRDTAPVASISREPMGMEVHPSFPAKSVVEFISYAKANPGKLSMGSAGVGTTLHMAGELFMYMTGIKMVHVPYRSSAEALTDLLAERVQVVFSPLPSSIEYVRTGRLRALAVTSATRSAALPDVPTVGDFVPGYEASAFYGISATKDTPAQIIDKLNQEINAGLADPQLKQRLAGLGSVPTPTSPAEFGRFIADETEKWGKVIRAANIKAE